MLHKNCKILYALPLLLYLFYANTISVIEATPKQKPLYSTDDYVVILNASLYKRLVYSQNFAWAIELYTNPCEACLEFATTWKNLAKDLEDWRDLVKIATMDCTNKTNEPLCKHIGGKTSPIVRYFHENYLEDSKVEPYTIPIQNDENQVRKSLLRYIIEEQELGRGKMYPNLRLFMDPDPTRLFKELNDVVKHVVLLIEKEEKSFGAEVTMDLHDLPITKVRYTYPSKNVALVRRLNITKLPTMMIFSGSKKNKYFHKVTSGLDTKIKIKKVIRKIVDPKHDHESKKENKKSIGNNKKFIYAKHENDVLVDDFLREQQREMVRNSLRGMKDPLFLMDLETALRWSFKKDIGSVSVISGEKYKALLNYLSVILKYFPFGKKAQKLIGSLNSVILKTKGKIAGKKIATLLTNTEKHQRDMFSSKEEWLACDRDKSYYGRYLCGLWKLFHYLTVKAAEVNANNGNANNLEVLRAIEGYVKHFLKCTECSKTTIKLMEEEDINTVSSLDSAIMWLWTIHNLINDKLSKQGSQASEFPKIQFPSPENCPACRNVDNTWNMNGVLKYMKQVYSNASSTGYTDDNYVNPAHDVFRLLDTTTRFLLYLVSAILILTVVRMFLKSGYRIKRVHNVLGKS